MPLVRFGIFAGKGEVLVSAGRLEAPAASTVVDVALGRDGVMVVMVIMAGSEGTGGHEGEGTNGSAGGGWLSDSGDGGDGTGPVPEGHGCGWMNGWVDRWR